jgi:hypothetical protein
MYNNGNTDTLDNDMTMTPDIYAVFIWSTSEILIFAVLFFYFHGVDT